MDDLACLDIDALIEATVDSELLGGADDQRLEDGIARAEEYRRALREAREQQQERFIALMLKIANRPRGRNVSTSRNAQMATSAAA